MGTLMAWDFTTAGLRDKFVGLARKNGVQIGACGDRSVRLRPMLTFGEKHAAILCSVIEQSLKEL